jgi:hypothetical protein
MSRALSTALVTTAIALAAVGGASGQVILGGANDSRCDLDGEIRLDVMVRYQIGHMDHIDQHVIWSVEGPSAEFGHPLPFTTSKARVMAIGDFHTGGACELLWQSDPIDGPLRLAITTFRLPGGDDFDIGTASPPFPWQIAASADFSGDGTPDLVWWQPVTHDRLAWISSANGGWDTVDVVGGPGSPNLPDPDRVWRPVGAPGLDAVDKPGLLWHSAAESGGLLYFRVQYTGSALVLHSEVPLDSNQLAHNIVAVGDFDRDGFEDLLWQHVGDSTLRVCFLERRKLRECAPMVPDVFVHPDHSEAYWSVVGPR